jgi:hypothetical protein
VDGGEVEWREEGSRGRGHRRGEGIEWKGGTVGGRKGIGAGRLERMEEERHQRRKSKGGIAGESVEGRRGGIGGEMLEGRRGIGGKRLGLGGRGIGAGRLERTEERHRRRKARGREERHRRRKAKGEEGEASPEKD